MRVSDKELDLIVSKARKENSYDNAPVNQYDVYRALFNAGRYVERRDAILCIQGDMGLRLKQVLSILKDMGAEDV